MDVSVTNNNKKKLEKKENTGSRVVGWGSGEGKEDREFDFGNSVTVRWYDAQLLQ